MDYLNNAERDIERSNGIGEVEWAQLAAQQAIAHALIALIQRFDKFLDRQEVEINCVNPYLLSDDELARAEAKARRG